MIGGYKPAFTLKTLGEWDREVGVPLDTTLRVLIETTNKTGEEAVSNCIVKMAQAVRKMTPKAKKNRTAQKDVRLAGSEYVDVYNQNGANGSTKLYRFRFSDKANARDRLPGTWEQAKRIGNAGMAQRSWFWGIRGLPGAPYAMGGKPYPGVAKLITLRGRGEMVFGQVLENRLAYITQIIPADYEAQAVRSVGNQVLGQYAAKMERDAQRVFNRTLRSTAGAIARAAA